MLAVAQPFIDPANDVAGDIGKKLITSCLIGMHIIFEQLRVVVRHLLEVRHDPAFIDGIAVKATGKLVVHATAGHFFQRGGEYTPKLLSIACEATGVLARLGSFHVGRPPSAEPLPGGRTPSSRPAEPCSA